VPTRLQKLKSEGLAGILLARAGLIRLNLSATTPHTVFSVEEMLPAVGQGAIAVECRLQDTPLLTMVQQAFHHEPTSVCIQAERALNLALGGSCQVPVAGLAVFTEGMIQLKARVGCLDGCSYLSAQTMGYAEEAELLGKSVAELLRSQGAGDIIETVRHRGFFA
jgi:hydroxymethylbilane synthase